MKKVSWLRILQDVDKAMRADNFTECDLFASVVRQAQIDGGYPTTKSMNDVAQEYGLICDFGAMNPTFKVRRIEI